MNLLTNWKSTLLGFLIAAAIGWQVYADPAHNVSAYQIGGWVLSALLITMPDTWFDRILAAAKELITIWRGKKD